MKPRNVLLILAVATVQLAVPASMLLGRERTLREGEVFHFRAAPVDPYDAFRGRYVWLSVGDMTAPMPTASVTRARNRTIYVSLGRDEAGFAVATRADLARPGTGAYVRTRQRIYPGMNAVTVRLPIERYYLPEDEAPAAEQAYRMHSRVGTNPAVVVVRVRNGDLVIEDLLVEQQPIREWLRRQDEEGTTL